MNFTKDQTSYFSLRKAVLDTGGVWFEGHLNMNLVGIRTSDSSRLFSDFLCLAYQIGSQHRLQIAPATTNPGAYWLKSPSKAAGTAVMLPGQYRGSHVLGLHKGDKPALVSRPGKSLVAPSYTRDDDRDSRAEQGPKVYSDFIGLNIHRSGERDDADKPVGKWSAGCQVLAHDEDMDLFLHLCKASVPRWGKTFTYTLLDAWW
jgi:hypothetical protein